MKHRSRSRAWRGALHATLALLFGLCLPRLAAHAQVVRGTVRESATGGLVAGVVVTLERVNAGNGESSADALNVLTDDLGQFALRARAAGRYRVVAKRIGSQRFTSDPFDIVAGETRRLDIEIAAVLRTLPKITVATMRLCVSGGEQAGRVAALWDEARAALVSASISQQSRASGMRLVRYTRVLDPRTLAVLQEERSEHSTLLAGQFNSVRPESLSTAGYWSELRGDSTVFYAPDAAVLLSDAFLRDHCFAFVEGRGPHAGHLGLAFVPAPDRFVNDIRGTMWIHGRTFELQSVDFRYTHVPAAQFAENNGGEVQFTRAPVGGWYVSRWYARMPQFIRTPADFGGVNARTSGVHRIIEVGGAVVPADRRPDLTTATAIVTSLRADLPLPRLEAPREACRHHRIDGRSGSGANSPNVAGIAGGQCGLDSRR